MKKSLLVSFAMSSLMMSPLTSLAANDISTKIVGGVPAQVGEFPSIASLQGSSGGHFCGGSLIKRNWVLTAAHCVQGSGPKKIYIGAHNQKNLKDAELFQVEKIVAHPQYNSQNTDYDFALIRLAGNSSFAPVKINTTEIDIAAESVMATTAGWGVTKENSWSLPAILQKVDVPLVTAQECSKGYPGAITDRMICAGYPQGGKDACQGDSGGPLYVKTAEGETVLAGVVSWGEGCARANRYGVYSKVNNVADWIENESK